MNETNPSQTTMQVQNAPTQISKSDSEAPEPNPSSHSLPYQPPTSGLVSWLPPSWVPYAELMRLQKPAGYYAFYLPHLFGTLYAAILLYPVPDPLQLLRVNLLFAIGSLLLRGAACTWNDTLDAPYDRLVVRCRHRPIARNAISPTTANIFTLAQSLIGAAILYQLPSACWLPATALVITLGLYPFAKRVTNYPQVVLGFSLALGQLVGAAGMGLDLLHEARNEMAAGMRCLYLSNVVNAIIYDAVYAHQDLKDDIKAGVKSVAVAWRERTKPILCFLSAVEVGLIGVTGYELGLGIIYFVCAVGGTASVLGLMIWSVKLDVSSDCGRWFKWTIWLTGGTLSSGLLAEYLVRI